MILTSIFLNFSLYNEHKMAILVELRYLHKISAYAYQK